MTVRPWPAGAVLVAALAGIAVWGRGRAGPRLLWYQGRPVQWAGERGVVLTADGDLFAARPGPRLTQLPLGAGERQFVDAAPAPGGAVWLADAEGRLVRRAPDGTLSDRGRTPFDVAAIASSGRALWAARSSVQFTYRPETDAAPLAVRLDTALRVTVRAGTARVPDNPFLAQLVNASRVLPLKEGGVVVAPFVRDEVIRFGPDGREEWRTVRRLPHATPNPPMSLQRDSTGAPHIRVAYAPVNLGLAQGTDGMIYVLSTVGPRTDSSRVDALDPATGAVLRTWRFATAQPTLAVTATGDVVPIALTPDVSAAGSSTRFAAFALPTPTGDSLRLSDLRGRVVLVNFWASWCAPCRDEFPALDSLAASFDTSRVVFVALSDDIARSGAEMFLAAHPVHHLRVGLGGGHLKDRYHYVGLPTTTLLDPVGRVAGRWIGFAGPGQIAAVRDSIARQLATAPAMEHHHM